MFAGVASGTAQAGGGYPHDNAVDCAGQFGTYSWCIDENGDGRFVRSEWLSSRGFAYRNCTDFVAWKLGLTWSQFKFGPEGGNAVYWKAHAGSVGRSVSSSGHVGDIAWWGGSFGHVAVVTAVAGDGSVSVQEYNKGRKGLYGTRSGVRADAYLTKGASAPPSPAPNGSGDRLVAGQGLTKGRSLTSAGGYFSLSMQTDGNMVLYQNSPRKALWSTQTVGRANYAILHGGGNLVLYGPSGAVWSTRTSGSGAKLVVQDDGNLVLYASGAARWASNTVQPVKQPVGHLEKASSPSRLKVRLVGWAADADSPSRSLRIHVYSGSTKVGDLLANLDRQDVAGVHPQFGANHGFDGSVSVPNSGAQNVCAWAINVGRGSNQKLGCLPVTVLKVSVPSAPPLGGVLPGDSGVIATWGFPGSDGGSAVTGYQVLASPGGTKCSADAGSIECMLTGLTNGTAYTFQVRARNAVGWSAWSAASTPVTPKNNKKCASVDITRDGRVDIVDLSVVLSDWGTSASRADANNDATVDIVDLSILLSQWGPCPYNVYSPQAIQLAASSVVTASTRSVAVTGVLKGRGGNAEVLGEAADGSLFGQAATDFGSNGAPVVWPGISASPKVVSVRGAKDLVFTDVNRHGLAVGIGRTDDGSNRELAWYRLPGGRTGVLSAGGADKAVARSVDKAGRVAGFLVNGVAVPVVWDSVTAAPRRLAFAKDDTGGTATAAAGGAFSGATRDDRLAVWDTSGRLSLSVVDGEAIDMNASGALLFGSASRSGTAPRVRLRDGSLVGLPDAPDRPRRNKVATALSSAGAVVGSYSDRPVLWPGAGKKPVYLPLPKGATAGRALGFGVNGRLLGWAQSRTGRNPVIWRVDDRPVAKVKIKAIKKKSKLHVNVNPNKGSGYWKFKVQKKRSNGSWKSLKTYRTQGAKETRTINLKKGKYRVKVRAKYGYRGTTSAAVRLKR